MYGQLATSGDSQAGFTDTIAPQSNCSSKLTSNFNEEMKNTMLLYKYQLYTISTSVDFKSIVTTDKNWFKAIKQ